MRHRTHAGRTYSWDTNFEGVVPYLERLYKRTDSDYMRSELERYMAARPCNTCNGKRLRPEALGSKGGRPWHHGAVRHDHWRRLRLDGPSERQRGLRQRLH